MQSEDNGYNEIAAAKTFIDRVEATHRFALSIKGEHSASNEEGEIALAAIDKMNQIIRKDMDAIANVMTKEESDAALSLFATLLSIVRHEKKLMAARKEFDALSSVVVH